MLICSFQQSELASSGRNSPRSVFAVEVNFVLDAPQHPSTEHVVNCMHDARQENGFLQVKGDAVVPHRPAGADSMVLGVN